MKLSKASFAAGAVAALVLGSGTAYAATGGNFILGKSNSAGATTSLTNSYGTPLALAAKSGTAPLKVNSGTKVTNLNADRLDGLNSTSFARSTMGAGAMGAPSYGEDRNTNGKLDTFDAFATCPDGSLLTGGGFVDDTLTGSVVYSAPVDAQTWEVTVVTDDSTDESGHVVYAIANCLNPTGAAAFRAVQRSTSPRVAR